MSRKFVITYALAALALAGCGGKDGPGVTEPPPVTPQTPAEFVVAVTGTWKLTTINDTALPVVVRLSPKLELLSDQLIVTTSGNSGTAERIRVFRKTEGSTTTNVTVPETGSFTLTGVTATFTFPGHTPSGTSPSGGTATITSSKLTIGETGTSYLYVKQ